MLDSFVLFLLLLGAMSWVVATSEPIVSADLCHLLIVSCDLISLRLVTARHGLFVEVKDDEFDLLLRSGVAHKLNRELLIWPVLASQIVKDGTSVAILFLEALGEHTHEKLLGEVLELLGVEFLLLVFALLLSLLFLLLLNKLFLQLCILLFKHFGSLFTESVATLLPEVDKLVETDQASLVLLSHKVGGCGATRALWADQDDVQLLVFFERRWHLNFKLISQQFSEFSLKITLKRSEVIPSLRDFLLGLAWFDKLRPVFTVFVFWIFFTVLFSTVVLEDLVFESIVLLDLDLSLLDLAFERLNLALVVILLLDGWPELGTRASQG